MDIIDKGPDGIFSIKIPLIDILLNNIDWGTALFSGGAGAAISVFTVAAAGRIGPILVNAASNGITALKNKITRLLGADYWEAIKRVFLPSSNLFPDYANLRNLGSDVQSKIDDLNLSPTALQQLDDTYGLLLRDKDRLDLHLNGHINGSGNAVGGHLVSAIDNVNLRLRTPQPPGLPEYYYPGGPLKKAAIDIKDETGNWISKSSNSTFFPDDWTNDKIYDEMAYILAQPSNNKINDYKWIGFTSGDPPIEIEIRFTGPPNNLTFDTVFPTGN